VDGVGGQIQGQILDRALVSAVLVWIVLAIGAGLWASELKKRRFWVWVFLSLLTGPVAWYLLFARLGVAVPPSVATTCPSCGRTTRKDMRRCVHCRGPLEREKKGQAANVGRQAATVLFTARRLLDAGRRAADAASGNGAPKRSRRARAPGQGTAPRDDSPDRSV
jgi:hypothetical protein